MGYPEAPGEPQGDVAFFVEAAAESSRTFLRFFLKQGGNSEQVSG
tara:strand:- start:676 stop:810 length:135 start_codon:yes stop_codon:yes gene_type:complete